MLLLSTTAESHWNNLKVVAESNVRRNQRERISKALGPPGEYLPRVDEASLFKYYQYLSSSMLFPFAAHYPKPATSTEESQYRCIVMELLDPIKDIFDEFDGIFCKTRHGKFETNLPLIELEISQDSPNFPLIEDYWFWFWNWR
jgi:hypothetical protein